MHLLTVPAAASVGKPMLSGGLLALFWCGPALPFSRERGAAGGCTSSPPYLLQQTRPSRGTLSKARPQQALQCRSKGGFPNNVCGECPSPSNAKPNGVHPLFMQSFRNNQIPQTRENGPIGLLDAGPTVDTTSQRNTGASPVSTNKRWDARPQPPPFPPQLPSP